MALSSKVISSKLGIEIDIFNNGKMMLQSTYSSTMKILSTIKYNPSGFISEIDKFLYNASGVMTSKHIVSGAGTLIEDINFGYTNGKLSTMTHYNSVGILTETDYLTNGVVSSIVMSPVHILVAPIVHAPVVPVLSVVATPVVSTLITQTSSDATPHWSNVSGYGGINIIKALGLEGITVANLSSHQQWGIQDAHFDDSIAAGYIGKGVVIADIDTGLDLNNKALTGNLSKFNWNFITNTSNVQDDNGHGSFTASEMVATDIGNGIVGASNGSQLMVLKALDSTGNGSAVNIANAINYAVDHGANVINLSLSSCFNQPLVNDALTYASQHNVLVSVASGNTMGVGPSAPANNALTLPNVVAVGSITQYQDAYWFTNSSNSAGSDKAYNFVDAPGVNISGYDNHGVIVSQSGTSMSSAYVASEMADLLSAYIQTHSASNAESCNLAVISAMTHGTDTIGLVGVSPAQLAAH